MESKRVLVTRPMVGLCHMQVCSVPDATDAEILQVCNGENPSGTSGGWGTVIRLPAGKDEFFQTPGPVPCADDPSRLHMLVGC